MYQKIISEVLKIAINNFCIKPNYVNQFKKTFTIVQKKIHDGGEYNFYSLVTWINENVEGYSRYDFLFIRKSIYLIQDYLQHGEITLKSYCYKNHYLPLYLSLCNHQLLEQYLKANYSNHFTIANKTKSISHFLTYLQYNNLSLDELNFEILYSHYLFCKETFSKSSFRNYCTDISIFIDYLFKNGCVKKYSYTYFMDESMFNHFTTIKEKIDIINSYVITIGNECSSVLDTNTVSKLDEFNEHYVSNEFSTSTRSNAIHAIKCYFTFIDYVNCLHSKELIEFWATTIIAHYCTCQVICRTAVHRYIDFIEGDFKYSKRYMKKTKKTSNIPIWAQENLNRYITYRKQLGYCSSTVEMDQYSIYKFLWFLDSNGVDNYNKITSKLIKKFTAQDIHKTAEGKNAYNIRIKNFLIYLSEDTIVSYNLSTAFISSSCSKKLKDVIDDDTVAEIYEGYPLFQKQKELRDYAISLIGLQTGLRGIDIVNLRFDNINLRERRLKLMQSKTKIIIELPLPVQCANAIYRYVKYGRPNTDSPFIFLTTSAPYRKVISNAAYDGLKDVLLKLNIEIDYTGFHITRRTFATKLLKKGAPIDLVISAIGHNDNCNVHKYIVHDDANMNKCTLPLTNIEYNGDLYD